MATIFTKEQWNAVQDRLTTTDEAVYLRIRFGSENSYGFGDVYADVPANEAANEEFFGDGKSSFVLQDGSKITVNGTQASIIAKAKHSYERCRGEGKALSFMKQAHAAFDAAKPENASEWWKQYAAAHPLTDEQLGQLQALFDAYEGPSGKRSTRKAKTFSEAEIAACVAKHGGDFMKAAAELGILK